MKYIQKEEEPVWFIQWKEEFKKNNGRQARYSADFSTDDSSGYSRRKRLRTALVKEQGYICCYCMKKINEDFGSHIEHFWPKSEKIFFDIDMDYSNLLASCEGHAPDDDHCGHRKDDWWHPNMMIPTNPKIEDIFVYWDDGTIHSKKGISESDIANQMIEHFGLNSFYLERNRREAINTLEVFDDISEEEYSDDDIRELINFYSMKHNGCYQEYSKALTDCLTRFLT